MHNSKISYILNKIEWRITTYAYIGKYKNIVFTIVPYRRATLKVRRKDGSTDIYSIAGNIPNNWDKLKGGN